MLVILATAFMSTANEVTIGWQIWMSKDLDISIFRNGDPIPQVKTKRLHNVFVITTL